MASDVTLLTLHPELCSVKSTANHFSRLSCGGHVAVAAAAAAAMCAAAAAIAVDGFPPDPPWLSIWPPIANEPAGIVDMRCTVSPVPDCCRAVACRCHVAAAVRGSLHLWPGRAVRSCHAGAAGAAPGAAARALLPADCAVACHLCGGGCGAATGLLRRRLVL